MARVALVDDQAQVRAFMSRALRHFGHEVTAAGSAREALAALEEHPHDLLITDLNMPDMDGIELITAVRDRWPSLPIIAISGGGLLPKELLLDNASALGALISLAKPLDLADLADAVERALATPGDSPGHGS